MQLFSFITVCFMSHHLFNEFSKRSMNVDKVKSSKARLKSHNSIEHHRQKSTEYLFQPIVETNDLDNLYKPPLSSETGSKYLKLLGQMKHYPKLSTTLTNKAIQVDDYDELSYKTAINTKDSYLSFYECICSSTLLLISITMLLFFYLNSYPIHCILNNKLWYQNDLSTGFLCENTTIEIHYVEIYSMTYQLEIKRNRKSINCLGFDILSCLPIDHALIPKEQIIDRNDQLLKYCNHTKKISCQNYALSILPSEYKWNLKNTQVNELFHCSCLINSNGKKCFHFKVNSQCDLNIPWFNYCLKHSKIHSLCQAYIEQS